MYPWALTFFCGPSNFSRYNWACSQNCSGLADGYASSEEPVFVIPGGSLQAGLVRRTSSVLWGCTLFGQGHRCTFCRFGMTELKTNLAEIVAVQKKHRAHIIGVCRRQVYEFSLNVTKGVPDADVVYGLLRSDVAIVNVEVSPNLGSPANNRCRCCYYYLSSCVTVPRAVRSPKDSFFERRESSIVERVRHEALPASSISSTRVWTINSKEIQQPVIKNTNIAVFAGCFFRSS